MPLILVRCHAVSAGSAGVQVNPPQSTATQCTVMLAAKSKGSLLAAQRYCRSIPLTECTADLSGLQLAELPDLADRWWLQSVAASCNKLRAPPPLMSSTLRTLSLAHNRISHVPSALAAGMPNLKVRSRGWRPSSQHSQTEVEWSAAQPREAAVQKSSQHHHARTMVTRGQDITIESTKTPTGCLDKIQLLLRACISRHLYSDSLPD